MEHLDPSEPSGSRTGKNSAGITPLPQRATAVPYRDIHSPICIESGGLRAPLGCAGGLGFCFLGFFPPTSSGSGSCNTLEMELVLLFIRSAWPDPFPSRMGCFCPQKGPSVLSAELGDSQIPPKLRLCDLAEAGPGARNHLLPGTHGQGRAASSRQFLLCFSGSSAIFLSVLFFFFSFLFIVSTDASIYQLKG